MTANEERQMGRAEHAVLSFLEQRLSVPKIYIDADWDGQRIDVLAINRDGVGDVHAALLFPSNAALLLPGNPIGESDALALNTTRAINALIDQLQEIPAQYKYICAVDVSLQGGDALPGIPSAEIDKSYSPDGIGRVGFLAVQFLNKAEPEVRVVLKPERFRAKIAKLANDYIQQHEADWEIRA